MNFKDNILKWGSYIFIGFITILLLVSLSGADLADFIGNAPQQTQFLAANVDGYQISNEEVNIEKEQITKRFGGGNIPDSFISKQAIQQTVKKKLLELSAKDSGFFPEGEKRAEVRAAFVRENFSQFKTKNGYDLKKLKEFFQERGLRYDKVQEDVVRGYVFEKYQSILNAISFGSELDALEKLRLEQIILSYRLIAIDNKKKEEILKSKIQISNREIKERFEKDYLAKDKKSKLTPTKREAIRSKIFNQKKSQVEGEWFAELKTWAQGTSLEKIALRNKSKVYTLKNVPLSQSLDQAKQKEIATSLVNLENNDTFRTQLFNAKLKSIIGPIKESNVIYLVSITDRKMATLPTAKQLMASKKRLNEILAQMNYNATEQIGQLKENHYRINFSLMFQLFENDAKIIYYR